MTKYFVIGSLVIIMLLLLVLFVFIELWKKARHDNASLKYDNNALTQELTAAAKREKIQSEVQNEAEKKKHDVHTGNDAADFAASLSVMRDIKVDN